MGLYLNPNADAFTQDINTRIYVDKSLVIDELNKLVCTKDDFCLHLPSTSIRKEHGRQYGICLLLKRLQYS